MVASHDIAASTAQLVAASRVKARPKSEKLKSLKSSSREGACVFTCVSAQRELRDRSFFLSIIIHVQRHRIHK